MNVGSGGDWGGGGEQPKSFVFTDFYSKCVIQGCQSFYTHTPSSIGHWKW